MSDAVTNSQQQHEHYIQNTKSKNAAYANESPLPPGLDSGDIVLFNRRCSAMPLAGAVLCVGAKLFSNSEWDHVGVIIRHPATGELLFLEADFGGVKLRSLEQRVRRSKSNEIAIRRLSVLRTSSMREKFYAFSQEMLGRPYEIGTGAVLARVADPLAKQEKERLNALLLDKQGQVDEITRELDSAILTTFQRRLLQSERDRVLESCQQIHQRLIKELDVSSPLETSNTEPDKSHVLAQPPGKLSDLSRVFCSQLVAAAYQRVGLLGSYPPPLYYGPKDFSSQQTHPPGLHLLKSARLSDEHYVRRSTRSSKDATNSSNKKVYRGVSDNDTPSRDARKTIRDSLKRTPIYNLVPDEYKRNHLLKSFRARIIDPGDVVFEQGQYGDQFYIIDSGAVERFMQKADEDPILVNTLGPRSTFGFTAFTYNTPRVSTVRAKERTLLWVLDRPTFELFRDASSDIKSILSAADNRRLRRLLQNHFLFKRFDKIGYEQVDAFFVVKFRAGETVFKQGDPVDNFYIVKSGELERHIRHPKRVQIGDGASGNRSPESSENALVSTFKTGQSFGELSLMYDAPRGSSVRARTDSECWAISAESFHRLNLSGGTQHLRAVFNKNASVIRDGEAYMTRADLLRFAGVDAFPEADRERLAALLVDLVASNRQRDPASKRGAMPENDVDSKSDSDDSSETLVTKSSSDDDDDDDDVLMDFWEFVRFDIVLNQPAPEMVFAFRLADQNNSGFISLDEMENLLQAYANIDDTARSTLDGKNSRLRRVFGKDGSRTLAAREFYDLSDNILPPMFVQDVNTLTHHMLNMDVVGGNLSRGQDEEELAFMEPDGGLSVIGSNFMNSSAKNGVLGRPELRGYSVYTKGFLPWWMAGLDWGHLVSVGVSGAVSRTAVAPLERLKILMQAGNPQKFPIGWVSSFRSMLSQDHGTIRAIFRGNGANVIRIIPSAAIQLIVVDRLRNMDIMRKLVSKDPSMGSNTSAIHNSEGDQVISGSMRTRAVQALLIGGAAGMVAGTATYPLDLVRGRLSVQRKGFEPYRGTLHGIKEAVRTGGIFSLYRGLGPSLAGVFPYVGLSFGIYETLRPVLPKKNDMSGIPTTGSSIFCGFLATATGQLASFPLDTCRRRMQIVGFDHSSNIKAKTFIETWHEIGAQMGWRGYFRGIIPNLLKVAPASAVSFVAYEQVRGGMKLAESSKQKFG